MLSIEEIRAEKMNLQSERADLEKQISTALKISSVMAEQLTQLEEERSRTEESTAIVGDMNVHMGVRNPLENDLPIIDNRRPKRASEKIMHWLTGRA
jgi:hypothetical protein